MKQERINKQLLISLIVLVVATIGLYFLSGVERTERPDPQLFRVPDLKEIDRITLESAADTVTLSYQNSQWLVNDTHPADSRMIQVLFATLQQAEPRRPVAGAIKDSVTTALAKSGVKVTLMSGGEVQKSFVAGGNESKTQAYLSNSQGQTYIVTIPGYRVYVSGIFELGESGFRDKYVFAFNWRNFKSLKAEFPTKPSENFEVAMDKEFFVVKGLAKTDTAKLNTYLDDVSLLMAQSFLPATIADSLQKLQPQLVITIEDIASRTYSLTLFQPQEKNKVMGLIDREPVYFETKDVGPVIRPRSFFIKQ